MTARLMRGRPTLHTRRMRLDPMTEEHLPLLVELDSDPEVLRYILGRARTAAEATEFWGPLCRDRTPDSVGLGFWVGFLGEEFVGWWDLYPAFPDVGPVTEAELGYRLRRAWWRQGLAVEGARELVRYGSEEQGLERIWAETMAVHLGSRAVMERLGMRHTSTEVRSWEHPIEGADQGEVTYTLWITHPTPAKTHL